MSTKQMRDEWQRLSKDATGVGFGKANAAFYMVAREAVPTLLQDVEQMEHVIFIAQQMANCVYHANASGDWTLAKLSLVELLPQFDAAIASVRK